MQNMSEQHPRHETQDERDEAYRNLAKLIKRQTIRHGSDFPEGDRLVITVLTMRTPEGQEIDLTRVRGFHQEHGNIDVVSVTLMHDANVFGKQTDYCSTNNGPFIRDDMDGNELGVSGLSKRGNKSLLEFAMGHVIAGEILSAAKERDASEGIDGFPITAEEAWNLTGTIEASTPIPRQ
jgi:hypothetical protein